MVVQRYKDFRYYATKSAKIFSRRYAIVCIILISGHLQLFSCR